MLTFSIGTRLVTGTLGSGVYLNPINPKPASEGLDWHTLFRMCDHARR